MALIGSPRWAILLVWSVLLCVAGCGKDDDPRRPVPADAGPTGDSPEVVACGRGEACPQGRMCDPFRGCVQCLFDEHCGPGQRCTNRECEAAAACSSIAPCATAKEVCDVGSGRCVQCLVDADCPRGNHCEERECKPYEACINSFDCKAGKVCGPGGECFQCVTNGDCALGDVCVLGSCAKSCDGDTDCLSLNQLCNTQAKFCAACVSDRDCPDTHHCAAGKCTFDACVQQSVRCASADTYTICSPNGDRREVGTCFSGSLCSGKDYGSPCVSQICVPGSVVCDETGTKQLTCAGDGLSYGPATSCPTGQRCAEGRCVESVCTPGAVYCERTLIVRCNALGTGSDTQEACASTSVCNPATTQCVAATCTVGNKTCQDGVPAECKDGLTYEKADACGDGTACVTGACVPVVCTPGKKRCDGATTIRRCTDDGSAEQSSETCFNAVCVEENGTAICKTKTCTPGEPTCEGDRLKTCNSLGTGVEGDGTDCTATNQVCQAGACRNVVCTGTRVCVSGNVHNCNNRGTDTGLYTTCSLPNVCLPNSGSAFCGAPICTPSAKACNGNAVATCNADGSGYLPGGTPCAANTACVNGTCLPVVCTPSAVFCNQGNVYSCGAQGVSSTLYSTCAASQHCYAQGSSAYCRTDVCTGGAPTCRDAFATTCAADGSGPPPTGGTNCAATGQGCDAGACKPIICDKGETFCKNGAIEQCNASGTASSFYTTCDTTSYCKDLGTSAACWGDICIASAPACDGEKPAVCDATGGGFVTGSANCATSGQVCNQSAVCSATAVDSIGSEGLSSAAAGGYLNVIEVRTARDLTQIEQHVAINGTAVLTWVVYERDAANTSALFTKILEKTGAASGTGTGAFVSSGAIDVPLTPTKIYAVGVIVGSSHSQSLIYPSAVMALSFGRVMSGGRISGTTAPATSSGFYSSMVPMQKLTTKLP